MAAAALLAASSLKRITWWTGMSSPMRTTKRWPRSCTTKFLLVMPPVRGSGSTAPDQQVSARTRATGSLGVMTGSRDAEPVLDAPAPGADQPVGNDADERRAQAGDDAAAGIGLRECREDLLAEVAGSDHGGDDVHGDGEHQHLVDAEHDLRQR